MINERKVGMMTLQAVSLFIFALSISAATATAEVSLPVIFGNDMVLQRDFVVPIWGWANPGEKVSVAFAGQKKSATANDAGDWMVKLDPIQASSEGRTLKISAIEITNVLVGDVWICSGQSNMEYGFRGKADKFKNSNVRMFRVTDHLRSAIPMDDTKGGWASFADGNSRGFSGVGLFFGCKLQRELNIPIGLIDTSWGGTPIEPWIAAEGYELIGKPLRKPDMTRMLKQQETVVKSVETWLAKAKVRLKAGKPTPFTINANIGGNAPNGIYNAMVAPLTPFGVKGAIWYQGESNRGRKFPDYFLKLKGLIEGWRKVFERPDFPFYIVQIAPYDYNRGNRKADDTILCNTIWATEFKAALEIKNCGVIPTHDTINGNVKDIHPRDKQPVGERLAAMALKKDYGKDVVCSGPVFKAAKRNGGKVIVSFNSIDKGLTTADGKPPTWFELSAGGKVFEAAEAVIDGATVIVTSTKVKEPKFVRMGWSEVAIPTLQDKNGWPAFQFGSMPID
jgi:sialate O-acetylesterase